MSPTKFARFFAKRLVNRVYVNLRALTNEPPEVPFLILGEARTGTNYLADLLRSHPDISVAGEILNPYDPRGFRLFFRSQKRVIRHIVNSLRALDRKCRGAQTHLLHFEMHRLPLEVLWRALPDLKFIVIFRRSLGLQYVSWKLAKVSGHWIGVSKDRIHRTKITVDPHHFQIWCQAVRRRYRALENCPGLWNRAVAIAYEDLVASPQQVMDQWVFPLFGVHAVEVKSHLWKQNPRELHECVENYAEVGELLERERLESVGPSEAE